MTMLRQAALGLICLSSLTLTTITHANAPPDGIHDLGFGTNGVAMASFSSNAGVKDQTQGIAVAPSGRIYIAATVWSATAGRFGLARFFPNGQLDPAFSGDGMASPLPAAFVGHNLAAGGVVVRADGRPLVYGWHIGTEPPGRMLVCRYAVAGNLDPSYDGDGCVTHSLALIDNGDEFISTGLGLPDERLLLGGFAEINPINPEHRDGLVVMLRADGSIDNSFGISGYTLLRPPGSIRARVTKLLRQSDGRFVVVGVWRFPGSSDRIFASRLTATGQLDISFGVNGYALISFADLHPNPNAAEWAESAAIDAQGRIYACGGVDSNGPDVMAFARLGSNGTLDPGFSNDGRIMRPFIDVLASQAVDCAVDAQDRLVAAVRVGVGGLHSNDDFGAIRFTPDGVEDTRFNLTGQTRVGIDLGGNGIGSDVPVALALVGGDVLMAGTSNPETAVVSANEVQTIIRLGSDRMFADSFEQ